MKIVEMLQKYKLSFEIWGLLLFLLVMIPNFVWFAVPAPDDILRTDSVTEPLDIVASLCQVLMVGVLCIFRNRQSKSLCVTPFITIVICSLITYFVCWCLYYVGIVNVAIILGLIIAPCIAFLFFAIDRKNGIAIIAISVFTLCHLIYGVVNFF